MLLSESFYPQTDLAQDGQSLLPKGRMYFATDGTVVLVLGATIQIGMTLRRVGIGAAETMVRLPLLEYVLACEGTIARGCEQCGLCLWSVHML